MNAKDYYHYSLYRARPGNRYGYVSEPVRPKIEILGEPTPPLHPFEDTSALSERVFGYRPQPSLDPLDIPGDRARMYGSQIDIMFQQLQSRNAISNAIRENIEYQECAVRSKLDEMQSWPILLGTGSRLQADLEKRLLALNKERWAEEVSCWRDTNRLLSGVFEHWSGYADQTRKARLMDSDL